jgi:UDPglucose 6-dehydrogenase
LSPTREAAAIAELKRPDRIVIGTEDERAAQVMRELYRPLYLNQAPILQTSRRTAELTKYAANAFLAGSNIGVSDGQKACRMSPFKSKE